MGYLARGFEMASLAENDTTTGVFSVKKYLLQR